jgi:hypothetical protein
MARPKNPTAKITVELQASPKIIAYLDSLRKMGGFGESRQDIVKNFVWAGINNLLLEKRLKQK